MNTGMKFFWFLFTFALVGVRGQFHPRQAMPDPPMQGRGPNPPMQGRGGPAFGGGMMRAGRPGLKMSPFSRLAAQTLYSRLNDNRKRGMARAYFNHECIVGNDFLRAMIGDHLDMPPYLAVQRGPWAMGVSHLSDVSKRLKMAQTIQASPCLRNNPTLSGFLQDISDMPFVPFGAMGMGTRGLL